MRNDIPVPAQVRPLVDVLGEERAIAYLLERGGSYATVHGDLRSDNHLVAAMGEADAIRLRQALIDSGQASTVWRVPLAKPWIAAVLHARGVSKLEIARRLHVSDRAVFRWIKAADPRQDDLFNPSRRVS